jgi:hypothetical protein
MGLPRLQAITVCGLFLMLLLLNVLIVSLQRWRASSMLHSVCLRNAGVLPCTHMRARGGAAKQQNASAERERGRKP